MSELTLGGYMEAVAGAVHSVPGPVYLRLKRGEIPVVFPGGHRLSLDRAQVLEWRGAETEFLQALRYNASCVTARNWYSSYLSWTGDYP